ncbi:MAG: hypothetical protein Q9193_006869, partial [Seirophora villosa]
QCLAAFPGRGRQRGFDDLVILDHARRHVGEQGAVVPEVDAHAVGVRGGEILARVGEGERGARALDAEGVDQMAGRQVPDADDRVHGRGDDPAAVAREAEVADRARAAPELAHQLLGLGVDDADGEVVAAERDQVARPAVLRGGDGGRGRAPVDLVFQRAGVEVPEFDLAVQAAADDRSVQRVDDQACHRFPVLPFPRAEARGLCLSGG